MSGFDRTDSFYWPVRVQLVVQWITADLNGFLSAVRFACDVRCEKIAWLLSGLLLHMQGERILLKMWRRLRNSLMYDQSKKTHLVHLKMQDLIFSMFPCISDWQTAVRGNCADTQQPLCWSGEAGEPVIYWRLSCLPHSIHRLPVYGDALWEGNECLPHCTVSHYPYIQARPSI